MEGGLEAESGARRAGTRVLGASFAASAAIHVLGIATGVVLARELGPTGRGELAAIVLWIGLLTELASLGVTQAITYRTARGAPVRTMAGTGMGLAAIQAGLAAAAGLALLPLVLSGFGEETLRSAHLYLIFIPLSLGALFLMGVLNGAHRFGAFQALRVLVVGAAAVAIAVLAATGSLDVETAVVAYLGANLLTALVAVLLVGRALPRDRPAGSAFFDLPEARRLLAFGIRTHVARVAAIFNERLPLLAVSVTLGAADLGLLVVAVTMTTLTGLVGHSTAFVALPAIARLEGDRERLGAARSYASLTLLLGAAISVPLIALAPQLIELLFGAAFADAATVSRVLLVAAIAYGTNRVLEAILQGLDRPLDAGRAEALALLASALALAALLPTVGLLGAGIAACAANAVALIYMARRASMVLDVRPGAILLPQSHDLAQLPSRLRSMLGRANRR